LLVFLCQWATVHANYGGNWTALFCTGAEQPHPPLVASEHVYLFPNSTGYDGQLYHYVAHDPLMRSDLKSYVDDPRLRYRRILIPFLAYALALGQSRWVDPAYELVFLIAVAAGVYWSCELARRNGFDSRWGLLFLLLPAVPVSADRLVVDAGLAALTAAFLLYESRPKLFLVLAAAALARETGVLLLLAYEIHLVWRRQFRLAGIFLLSALPALFWYAHVQARTVGVPYGLSFIPLSAIVHDVMHPWPYAAGTPFSPAARFTEYLAVAGVLLSFALAIVWYVRKPAWTVSIAAMLFALMGLFIQRYDQWQNVYDFGRVFTPSLACLALIAARERKPWLLAPIAMVVPRIVVQLGPQTLGIVRWIAP
jgi:hypothetical protein